MKHRVQNFVAEKFGVMLRTLPCSCN